MLEVMKVVKISELRRNLQDIVDSVYYTKKPIIIMRRNKVRAVIVPLSQEDESIKKAIKRYAKNEKK